MVNEYIRLISFIIVFLTSLISIKPRRYCTPVFFGAILISLYLAGWTILVRIMDYDGKFLSIPYTVIAVVWALMHLNSFLKK